jgi:hypothetical protein
MFTTQQESDFFISEITKTHRVLEYGSGESTIEIADKCLSILSIEHQKPWYDKLIELKPINCELVLREPNLPYKEGGHCGTYEQFKSYIEAPLNKGPFDIILIDGRARVACASIVKSITHDNTLIFIHDYDRPEYAEVLNYLELIGQVGTMGKFKIKK